VLLLGALDDAELAITTCCCLWSNAHSTASLVDDVQALSARKV